MIISEREVRAITGARCANPHDLLGMHVASVKGKKTLVVRAFLTDALSCEVVAYGDKPEKRYPLKRVKGTDLFEGVIPGRSEIFAYRLRIERRNGEIRQFYDPYCFLPTLSEDDLYLFNKGDEHRVYEKLGSHLRALGDVKGVSFAVWAPTARRVSVVGDFNNWDGRIHPMRPMGASGVWEIFIPGLEQGAKYKYEILDADNTTLHLKSDPYAARFEPPPHNASVVWDLGGYQWGDDRWIEKRARTNWQETPMSVYELHMGSWKRLVEQGGRPFSYRELAPQLIDYLKQTGFTHVEFLPLNEFPFEGSWGYQVTGFYAVTQRYGTPQEFMFLVDELHKAGYGVVMDWVPGHFPKDAFALAQFDGSHLYEHADPRQGEHQEWGTLIFNYGRREVVSFLTGSALAWFDRYHIDALRVDAVASMLYLDYARHDGQWIANRYGGRENIEAIEFLRHTNSLVHLYHPGALMIAEESTSFGGVTKPTQEGGLGFDFKWDMGWMHDTLAYFQQDPLYRPHVHDRLTFPMLYQYHDSFILVLSHDEVVHGKGSLVGKMSSWNFTDKVRNLRVLMALMWLWPGKKTLFMGCEFAQVREWKYDESLDWHLLKYPEHAGVQKLVGDLNTLYRAGADFAQWDQRPEGFQWIECEDKENSVLSFLRVSAQEPKRYRAVVCNMTPITREHYRIGLPEAGKWREVVNTNSSLYGGFGEGNRGEIHTEPRPWHKRPHSAEIFLPGLTAVVFEWGESIEAPAQEIINPPAPAKKKKQPAVKRKKTRTKKL